MEIGERSNEKRAVGRKVRGAATTSSMAYRAYAVLPPYAVIDQLWSRELSKPRDRVSTGAANLKSRECNVTKRVLIIMNFN